MGRRRAVVAIGGNSLIRDSSHQSVPDQYEAAGETCRSIATMIADGWDVVVGHGNGPQVGFILRRSELALGELHEVPLDVCGADTQGAIGYMLQQQIQNELCRIGARRSVVSVVTQVEVDPADPAFQEPSKPIGSYMAEEDAVRRRSEEGWAVREDAGRGWRRVVPSPTPRRVVEEDVIRGLVDDGVVVIAAGGGGVPVLKDGDGNLRGVAAVIDKDLSASLLACSIGADLLLICTAVEQVALDFGTPRQRWIAELSLSDAKRFLESGAHFAEGSMAPKIRACVEFIEHGGAEAIITNPGGIERALRRETGTRIGRRELRD